MKGGRLALDLTGQRFGRLVPVKRIGTDTRQRTALWWCDCDCGGGVVARSNSLTTLNTQSCGCHRREQAKLNTSWQQRSHSGRFIPIAIKG
jgi:hypothetical protein